MRSDDLVHRIVLVFFGLIIFGSLLFTILWFIGPELYYLGSAPIVLPQHSAEELWANPLPTSVAIREFDAVYYQNLDKTLLCIDLNVFHIWEAPRQDESAVIQNTTGITVDGQTISRRDMEHSQLTVGLAHYDEQGNYIGSHGGDILVCFGLPERQEGLHVATIRFESNIGTEYTYEWAFRIRDERTIEFPF